MVAGFGSDPVNTESPAFAHAFGYSRHVGGRRSSRFFGAGAVTRGVPRRRPRRRLAAANGGDARRARRAGSSLLARAVAAARLRVPRVAGFGYLGSNTPATTRLALGVEPWQRGRIMALWSIAFLGLRRGRELVDGAVAGAVGVRAAGVLLATPRSSVLPTR